MTIQNIRNGKKRREYIAVHCKVTHIIINENELVLLLDWLISTISIICFQKGLEWPFDFYELNVFYDLLDIAGLHDQNKLYKIYDFPKL